MGTEIAGRIPAFGLIIDEADGRSGWSRQRGGALPSASVRRKEYALSDLLGTEREHARGGADGNYIEAHRGGGLIPPKGVYVLRWDVTPDNWGIILFEADSAMDAGKVTHVWRMAGAGFFQSTKTAPAVPITAESEQAWAATLKAVKGQ